MTRLNLLTFESSSDVALPKEVRNKLRGNVHHVSELLEHYLGKDYVLDGSGRLTILAGGGAKQSYVSVLGCSTFCLPDFDVEACLKSPIAQQQEMVLEAYVKVLTQVGEEHGADTQAIQKAAKNIRDVNFTANFLVKKLCRDSPDKRLRIVVYRRLGPTIGEIWEAEIIHKRMKSVLGIEPLTPNPHTLDRTSHFSSSQWNGSRFEIVYAYLKSIEAAFDISKYLAQIEDEGI